MDSFIIRIFYRPEDDYNSMTGIIEDVDNQHKKGFTTQEELWEMLRNTKTYFNHQDDSKDKND